MILNKNHSGLDSNGNMWKIKEAVSMLKLAVACWREWHVEEKSMLKRKVRRREKHAEGKSTQKMKTTHLKCRPRTQNENHAKKIKMTRARSQKAKIGNST